MGEDLDGILDDILEKDKRAQMEKDVAQYTMKHQAPFLELLANIYNILAYIGSAIFLFFVILGIIALFGEGDKEPIIKSIFQLLLGGAFLVITGLAISEGIKLFIKIEANTRKQVLLLTKLVDNKNKEE